MRVLASHLWIMAALLSVVMISCGREEPEEQKKPEDFDVNEWENTDIDGDATMSAVPIEFNIENTGEVMRGVTPFNGEGYVFSPGDRITIELTRNGVATQKVYKVATVVTDPLEFDYDYDPTGLPFYWETKDDIQMRAWSYGNSTPYTKDPVGNPFALNTDQREVTSGKDNYKELLYSPQQTYSYSSSVPIKLYHQLARLTINLTHEASGDLSVSQVTIGNSSLPTTATFNEKGINIPSSYVGSWAGHSSATGQVIARADVANQKYSAVLFPNTYTAGNKIVNVKTSDNNTYAYELPSGGVTLNAGKQYNYTITVKDNGHVKTTTTKATRSILTVGDVLCSDGSIYAAADASFITKEGKTAIGIIAYIGTNDSDPVCESRKALVMALKDCGKYTWGPNTVDENNTYFPNQIPLTDYGGYSKTTYAISDGHSHPAFTNAVNWKSSADWTGCGSTCTGWFLGSGGQWKSVFSTMGGTNITSANNYFGGTTPMTSINNYLSVVGSGNYTAFTNTCYWTASEYSSVYSYFIGFTSSGVKIAANENNDRKILAWPVRSFLAF